MPRLAAGGVAVCLLIAALLAAVQGPAARAHHSYVGDYDGARVVTLKGTIAAVDYRNPHIFFTLETADGAWRVETESIPKTEGKGLRRGDLSPGATVAVTGWPANGAREIGLKSITLQGGRTVNVRGSVR